MTICRSLSLGFSLALSLMFGGRLSAGAQVSSAASYHQILASLARLDRALCSQSWTQAISITSNLIASPEVSAQYRQELLGFRRQLESWQLASSPPITQDSCDRVLPLYLSLPAPEAPEVQPLDWNRALATLNSSSSIIDLDDTYDPLANLIPAELLVESPESLVNLATPVDTADGFGVIGGHIRWGPEVYSFLARQGDRLSLEADVTNTSIEGVFQVLLFDRHGRLLAQSNQSDVQTSMQTYRIPTTDVYFAAIAPTETAPILDQQGHILGWQPVSRTTFNYTLTLTGVTPYAELLPNR